MREHFGVLVGYIPLVGQIVEFFHWAIITVIHISTSYPNVQAAFRLLSFAATLLTRQSLPTPTIVMFSRSAVSARFIYRAAVRTNIQTLLTRISTLVPQILRVIWGRDHKHISWFLYTFNPLKFKLILLPLISIRRALTARAGFAGVRGKAGEVRGRNWFVPVDV